MPMGWEVFIFLCFNFLAWQIDFICRLKNSPIHYISLPSALSRTGLGPGHQGALSSLSSLSETLSHLNLAELPKTGAGLRVKNLAKLSSKPVTVKPPSPPQHRHGPGHGKQNSKIIHPNVPFLINGKPHSPHVLNKQKWKKHKKKKKKDRLSTKPNEISTTETKFSTKVKPHKVNKPIEIVPDASTRVTEQRSKNKTISRLAGTSKNAEMSESGQNSVNSSHKKSSKVKSRPTNSPIYTYQLPPNLSFNSLRSILGSIKGGDHTQPKVKTTKKSTTKRTTTTTTTTTTTRVPTTTTTTTTERAVSQVFTYKLPPFFSASAFKKFLIGYGHAKHSGEKNPFSLTKYIRGKSSARRSTTTTSTTTRRTTTTLRATTTVASPALLRSPGSPITWIAGKLTGIPSRIFNFKVPFSLLSWIDNLGSSHHKSEPIKHSTYHKWCSVLINLS